MFIHVFNKLKYFYKHSDPLATELWLYSVAIFVGIWFANPFHNLFSKTRLFSGISNQAVFLGICSVFGGFAGVIALAYNLTAVRKAVVFLGALFWVYLSAYIIINDPFFSSFPLYLSICLQNVWLFFKIKPEDR